MYTNLYTEVKKAYAINNLDFDRAVEVWLENNISLDNIQHIIHEDCGKQVSAKASEYLIKKSYMESYKKYASIQELNALEDLETKRYVKLTPSVKKLVHASSRNTFTSRFGQSNVEWTIILVDNVPHLARKEVSEKEVKYSNNDGLEREWLDRIKKNRDPFTNIPEADKEKEKEHERDSDKNC